MLEIKRRIAESLAAAFERVYPGHGQNTAEFIDLLAYPPDEKLGDLSFPCFKFSRVFRESPQAIAQKLAEAMAETPFVTASAVAGYLNFVIDPGYFTSELLGRIISDGDRYGSTDVGAGKTVVFDYSSPNVCKPFHIGHLGTTVIGHSLKMIYAFAGYKCIGVNHLGDWGTQFGKLIVAIRKWHSGTLDGADIDTLVKLYVRFNNEAADDPSLEDEAREEFRRLEGGDADDMALWRECVDLSITEYKKTYRQLGIEFDYYTGESFYFPRMQPQIDRLRERGLLRLDDGATIVDLSEYKMPPCIILKKDGSTIYATRDITAAAYRHDTFNFDKCIYVTSSGQCLHFAQWFKVCELMGYDWADRLEHVPYGTVSIDGGKLSTRTGNVVLLRDLFAMAIDKVKLIIDEKNPDLPDKESVAESIGVGAIVFHYLSNSRIKDIDFILEDALSFEGNTGPYAQYTYARCCSLIDRAGGIGAADRSRYEPEECEIRLLKTLSMFSEKLLLALRDNEPMVIARYIIDVSGAFNRFYHELQILSADDEAAKRFRLRLTEATRITLHNAFGLICMKSPRQI